MKIDVITTKKEFEAIRERWGALLANSGGNIFQTWEWQWSWWKYYARDKKLYILVATEKDLVGIAPFCLSKSYYGLPIKVLSLLGTGPSDYGGFIVLPEKKERFIEELLKHLSTTYVNWDVVDLQQLPEDLPYVDLFKSLIKGSGFGEVGLFQDDSLTLSLPSNWDELAGTLSKKFRHNLSYCSRRIFKEHKVDIYNLNERADDVVFGMNVLFNLHQKRWRARKLPGLFWSKRYRAFHSDIASHFYKKGWLALYLLKLDDEAAASLYGFEYDGRFYYYLGGFDPRWEHLSIGTFLTGEAIRDSIAKKFSYFDFLRGGEKYKLKWRAVSHKNMRFLICKENGCLKTAVLPPRLAMQLLDCETEVLRKAKNKLRKV